MTLFLPVLFFLIGISHFLDFLRPLSESLHMACIEWVQESHTSYKDIHKALLCGKKLGTGSLKKIFMDTGIVHLMVVSGLHLVFLEKIWNALPKWPYKNFIILFSLILYTLVAQLHPPIVRAFLYFLILKLSRYLRLFWNPIWITLWSGIGCLIFNPQWISSISLQMSWIGSMAFHLPFKKQNSLQKCLIGYILFLPIVSAWHNLNPLSIFVNWVVTPVVSTLLFPLSIFSFFIPPLYFITDTLWSFLITGLSAIQSFLQYVPFYIPPLPVDLRWTYIAFIFICIQILAILTQHHFYKKPKMIYPLN